uniref:Zinc finger CHCC-type domain-containing protein n=1 Tax=Romanomermis culicivorax TaxID=13658 RepID=A0A915HYN9_ROMCU
MPPVEKLPATRSQPTPLPGTVKEKDLKYDQVTHTGQAWDQEDWRLSRFTYNPKHVNPNVAMHLIAKIAPKAVHGRKVYCDGGDGALGHPKVYINLDKPGNHACGYCGLRFYQEGLLHDGSEHINA